MTELGKMLRVLSEGGVQFILVGGAAATVHGSSRLTQDLDVVYDRSKQNITRLVDCLAPYHPYPRGAPSGLPFRWDERTLNAGLNFTLTTTIGDLDLLGEITGGGKYADLLPHSIRITVFGCQCDCLDLETLIKVKRAAGRPKDFEAVAELESIRAERSKGSAPIK